jgi:hypothetical protein
VLRAFTLNCVTKVVAAVYTANSAVLLFEYNLHLISVPRTEVRTRLTTLNGVAEHGVHNLLVARRRYTAPLSWRQIIERLSPLLRYRFPWKSRKSAPVFKQAVLQSIKLLCGVFHKNVKCMGDSEIYRTAE